MKHLRLKLLFCITVFLAPTGALAANVWAEQSNLDHVWTMIAAALVFSMQGGFLLLEAGQVRAKNAVNVAQKNLIDFILSTICFGLFGYTIMFGASYFGVFGWSWDMALLNAPNDWSLTFFVFQLVFCGTAATIVSGAVAERMNMTGYIAATVLIASVIYPVTGHWAWGGLLNGSDMPWLAALGFLDFAGSTVVHSVGAWVGLAAMILIGARAGKFDENGKPVLLHGHSPVLSTMGAIILWVGWIGFNGGSTTAGTSAFAQIIANTMVAAGFGGASQFLAGRYFEGYHRPEFVINGSLAGLVGITAGCDVLSMQTSAIVGMSCGLIAYAGREFLERICKLDDPLGAVSVHGVAGAAGTILLAVFAPMDVLPADSRLAQIGVQAIGVGSIFVYAFGVSFAVLWVLNRTIPNPDGNGRGLRVPSAYETQGLNVAEHKAPLGIQGLVDAMYQVAHDPNAEVTNVPAEPGDESFEAATLFNEILEQMREKRRQEAENSASADDILQFQKEMTAVIEAYSRGDFDRSISVDKTPRMLRPLSNALNAMAVSVQTALTSVESVLKRLSNGDLTSRVDGDYEGVVQKMQDSVNQSITQVGAVLGEIEHVVHKSASGDFSSAIPTENKAGYLRALSEGVNRINKVASKGLADISQAVGSMAAGDLTWQIPKEQVGAFGQIATDIDHMADETRQIIDRIKGSSHAVEDGAQSIKSSSAQLLGTAQENVGLVNHLVKEIDGLRQELENNNTLVREALTNAGQAREAAESALAISSKTVDQMNLTFSSVTQIERSVEEIEEIASKTRLLSLNASVEAAKAPGRVGAGFAVVAQEVRDLAQTISENARNIRSKTESVRASVETSVESVHGSDDIVSSIHGVIDATKQSIMKITETSQNVLQAMDTIDAQMRNIAVGSEKASAQIAKAAETAETLIEDADATRNLTERFNTGSTIDKAA